MGNSASFRHRRSVYAIDPRGKARPGEEGYTSDRWMVGLHDDVAKLAQGALREITEMTGGFAFTGSDSQVPQESDVPK